MRKTDIALLIGTLLMAGSTSMAQEYNIFGPRAFGMGGASVAAGRDGTVVYGNPATLAF